METKKAKFGVLESFVLLSGYSSTMLGGFGVLASFKHSSLWPETRKYPSEELQQMWNQGYWSWKQLFLVRQLKLICSVTFLPISWGHPGFAIWSENWHLVSWLHLGGTVHWWSKFPFWLPILYCVWYYIELSTQFKVCNESQPINDFLKIEMADNVVLPFKSLHVF